jgi:hypothetical protein
MMIAACCRIDRRRLTPGQFAPGRFAGLLTFVLLAIPMAERWSPAAETSLTDEVAAATTDLGPAGHPGTSILRREIKNHTRVCAEIEDYTCVIVKRERVRGRLRGYEYLSAKVRHHRENVQRVVPFSVYLKFLGPSKVKGREVLYVEGENDSKLVVRTGETQYPFTTKLRPTGELAMRENRHPITEFGFENFGRRLIQLIPEAITPDQVQIEHSENSKVDGRECTGIVVTRTKRTQQYRFHRVRIFFDRELQIPIHYEAYDWPKTEGGKPVLLEQYTFRDIVINPGLTDGDFRRDHPKYGFTPAR